MSQLLSNQKLWPVTALGRQKTSEKHLLKVTDLENNLGNLKYWEKVQSGYWIYQQIWWGKIRKTSLRGAGSVQFNCSVVSNSVIPWTAAPQASLSITNSWSLLKLMSIMLMMPSNHHILCCPFLLPPSIFPSIRVFSNELVLHIRWPKYWSFSFNISPSNEYSGLISFRMDWFDLPAVQGTLKSLLQHHNSKASILQCSAFFTVQLSHPYMTTGKIIALTRWTFIGKVMLLLFNMLSRLVITFLPRSKHLLISCLQSPSAVILEPPKIKSVPVSIVSPSTCHEVMEPDAMILVFWMLSFKPIFSLFSFTFFKRLFSSSSLSVIRVVLSPGNEIETMNKQKLWACVKWKKKDRVRGNSWLVLTRVVQAFKKKLSHCYDGELTQSFTLRKPQNNPVPSSCVSPPWGPLRVPFLCFHEICISLFLQIYL